MEYLKSQRLSHIIGIVKGRGHAPPSRYCLHLFHELIPLISTQGRCISAKGNPLGLPYLRSIGVTFAETLQELSEGFYHLRKVAPELVFRKHAPESPQTNESIVDADADNEDDSRKIRWPYQVKRLGEVLAQAIHCMCGISTKNKQPGMVLVDSEYSDTLSFTSEFYGNFSLYENTRFKVGQSKILLIC